MDIIKEVVDDKKLNIIQKHRYLLLIICLFGIIVYQEHEKKALYERIYSLKDDLLKNEQEKTKSEQDKNKDLMEINKLGRELEQQARTLNAQTDNRLSNQKSEK